MKECVSLGLKECPWCISQEQDNPTLYDSNCWLLFYDHAMRDMSDAELKQYYIAAHRPNPSFNHLHLPDWSYYCTNAIKKLLPERLGVIEKLMLLL